MRQMLLAWWLSASVYVVGAQLPQPPTPPAAKQCQPTVWDVLLKAGWAYATKSPLHVAGPRPCPDNSQEAQPKARATPTPVPKADLSTRDAPADNSLAELPATEVLRLARLLYVRSRSSWFNKEKLERELLKRREFGELGLELTRKVNDANLVLEITRKTFTTRFTCSVIEPSSERIVGSTTASSLGGEIEPHLAEAIIKQFKAARSAQQKEE